MDPTYQPVLVLSRAEEIEVTPDIVEGVLSSYAGDSPESVFSPGVCKDAEESSDDGKIALRDGFPEVLIKVVV